MSRIANIAEPTTIVDPESAREPLRHISGGPKPDRDFRQFLAASRRTEDDDDGDRYAGFGMTLDAVLANEVRAIEMHVEADSVFPVPQDPGDILDRMGDVVVWDGGRVAAVVQPRRDGVQVARLGGQKEIGAADTPTAPPRASAVAGPQSDRKFRAFTTTVADIPIHEEDYYHGLGMTVDAVLADIDKTTQGWLRREVPKIYPTVDDALCESDDIAIWGPEPHRLAAVVLQRPGGVQVLRLDKEIPDQPEVGPTNAVARETPREVNLPDPKPLSRDEQYILDAARKIGLDESCAILQKAKACGASEALARLGRPDPMNDPEPAAPVEEPEPIASPVYGKHEATLFASDLPSKRNVVQARPSGPLPLLRASLTIANPADADPEHPVASTVEIIVLAGEVHEGDSTATVDDLPELKEAGWRGHMTGPLDVHTRVIID